MWYIYNGDLFIIATANGPVDEDDLASRGQRSFYSDSVFQLGQRVILDENGEVVGAEPTEEPTEEPMEEPPPPGEEVRLPPTE